MKISNLLSEFIPWSCMDTVHKLVNIDKQETISFFRIDTGTKMWELTGTAISSSLITYYLLKNIGDRITFINNYDSPFVLYNETHSWNDFDNYTDVTGNLVSELINEGIYREDGMIWIDEDESLYYRDLTNIFDPKVTQSQKIT